MTEEDARQAAAEAWRGLVEFWTKRNLWVQVAGALGISPGHAKALTLLDADDPPAMGVLAEGLGLAVVEAQAAGVPCLVATSVPSEVAQSPLVSWLPLKESPAVWARRALVLARTMRRPLPSTVGWTYELRTSLRALEEQYLRPTIEANRRWISSSL